MTQGGSLLLGSGERLKPLSKRYTSHSSDRAKRNRDFPFDVPFLPERAVWQLVEQAKPISVSDRVFVQIRQAVDRGDIPDAVLTALSPWQGKRLRLTEDEFRREAVALLGAALFAQHGDKIEAWCRQCATIAAPWTPERARAHVQEEDVLKRRASASDRLWRVWREAERRGRPLTETQLRRWVRIEQLEQMMTPPMWMTHRARLRGVSAETLWDQELRRRGTSLEAIRAAHMEAVRGR